MQKESVNEVIAQTEERLLKLYRKQFQLALEVILSSPAKVNLSFYQGSADLLIEIIVKSEKDGSLKILEKIVPQKTCYCVKGKPVVAGHPLASNHVNKDHLFAILGERIDRWQLAYNATKNLLGGAQ